MSNSVGIVYDDIGGGGQLFGGKKLWVARRVPCRPDFVQKIKLNGGMVVPLEKNADVLIADHARKDAPPNSFSWKWIEDCLKKGALQDLKDYPAGPQVGVSAQLPGPEDTVHTGFTGGLAKQTRTKFTAEDDRVLSTFVNEKILEGYAIRGNGIYDLLAQKNPRHTSQSWRDRYIKYVSRAPPSTISARLTIAAAVPSTPSAASEQHLNYQALEGLQPHKAIVPLSLRRGTVYIPPLVTSSSLKVPYYQSPLPDSQSCMIPALHTSIGNASNLGSERNQPVVTPPQKYRSLQAVAELSENREKAEFTEEDRGLLEENYDDILELSPTRTVEAWEAWAKSYPQHTAGQWHTYFETMIKPAQSELRKKRKEAKLMAKASLSNRNKQQVMKKSIIESRSSFKQSPSVQPLSCQAQKTVCEPEARDRTFKTISIDRIKPRGNRHTTDSNSSSLLLSTNSTSPPPRGSSVSNRRREFQPSNTINTYGVPASPVLDHKAFHPSATTVAIISERTAPTKQCLGYKQSLIDEFPRENIFSEKLSRFRILSLGSRAAPLYINQTLLDKDISLWTLFLLVNSSKHGGSEMVDLNKKWAPIATQLGFNCLRQSEAPEKIRTFYEEYLVDFERNYRQFLGMKKNIASSSSSIVKQVTGIVTDEKHPPTQQRSSVVEISDDSDEDGFTEIGKKFSSDDALAFTNVKQSAMFQPSPSYKRPLASQPSLSVRKRQRVGSDEPEIPESPT